MVLRWEPKWTPPQFNPANSGMPLNVVTWPLIRVCLYCFFSAKSWAPEPSGWSPPTKHSLHSCSYAPVSIAKGCRVRCSAQTLLSVAHINTEVWLQASWQCFVSGASENVGLFPGTLPLIPGVTSTVTDLR